MSNRRSTRDLGRGARARGHGRGVKSCIITFPQERARGQVLHYYIPAGVAGSRKQQLCDLVARQLDVGRHAADECRQRTDYQRVVRGEVM